MVFPSWFVNENAGTFLGIPLISIKAKSDFVVFLSFAKSLLLSFLITSSLEILSIILGIKMIPKTRIINAIPMYE